MSKLPVIPGYKCIKILEKKGFCFKRQMGSHIVLGRDDPFAQLVVPDRALECTGQEELIVTVDRTSTMTIM